MSSAAFFSKEEKQQIVEAIKKAETFTTGEIRVHIDARCKGNVLDCAAWWFKKLNMHKTELRNGVLIYLAVTSKKFAIIGDQGINSVVPADFWNSTKEQMQSHFLQANFTEGLVQGILMAGNQLSTYFPLVGETPNEQPDEISFGK